VTAARFITAIVADRRLFLDENKETVIEEGDPRAAFLLVGPGSVIPAETVTRLRLAIKGGQVVQVMQRVAT